jgi:hypothetical protein
MPGLVTELAGSDKNSFTDQCVENGQIDQQGGSSIRLFRPTPPGACIDGVDNFLPWPLDVVLVGTELQSCT